MPPTRRGGGLLKTWGRYCSQAAKSSGEDGMTTLSLYLGQWLEWPIARLSVIDE